MHTEMWEHPAVRAEHGDAASPGACPWSARSEGRLAGGDVGAGRLAEPAEIVAAAAGRARPARPLVGTPAGTCAGLRVLVTAGGTREAIDPVRFLGNRSSGKQGHAVAEVSPRPGRRGRPW